MPYPHKYTKIVLLKGCVENYLCCTLGPWVIWEILGGGEVDGGTWSSSNMAPTQATSAEHKLSFSSLFFQTTHNLFHFLPPLLYPLLLLCPLSPPPPLSLWVTGQNAFPGVSWEMLLNLPEELPLQSMGNPLKQMASCWTSSKSNHCLGRVSVLPLLSLWWIQCCWTRAQLFLRTPIRSTTWPMEATVLVGQGTQLGSQTMAHRCLCMSYSRGSAQHNREAKRDLMPTYLTFFQAKLAQKRNKNKTKIWHAEWVMFAFLSFSLPALPQLISCFFLGMMTSQTPPLTDLSLEESVGDSFSS